MSRLPKNTSKGARLVKWRAPSPSPLRAAATCAALALALPGIQASAQRDSAETRELQPLEVFQRSEDLLFRVGYRLSTANADFCPQTVRASGMLIHDAESYGDPVAVRRLFGLHGGIGVPAGAPPRCQAGKVVVAEHPGGSQTFGECRQLGSDGLMKARRRPARVQPAKVERELQSVGTTP